MADRPARGDIVLVAGGVYASTPRPAVVLQDDLFDATASLTVCPFTTVRVEAPLLRVPIPADSGVADESFAMVDKVTTVRLESVGAVIGRVEPTQMLEIERRLVVFLGLAR